MTNLEKNDPYRLKFHITPSTGWMNDPNGFCWYKGEYHLFYQAYPYAPENGIKHWGHVHSTDLVEWKNAPLALFPDEEYDRDGCYSGGAIEKDGKLFLVYTGHRDKECINETQNLAYSENGVTFYKIKSNPIIESEINPDADFRDPFVWKQNGMYYCLVGNRKENHGRILLYESKDIIKWKYKSIFLEGNDDFGFMWECPVFLEFGENSVLIISIEGLQNKRHSTWYSVGKANLQKGKFYPESWKCLDYGTSFYAPQAFAYKDRKLLIGWMDKWFSDMPSCQYGWAGAMSIVRELKLDKNNILQMQPVKELEKLVVRKDELKNWIMEKNHIWNCGIGMFTATIDLNKCIGDFLTLKISSYDNLILELQINFSLRNCTIRKKERKKWLKYSVNLEKEKELFSLKMIKDVSSVEFFLQDGRVCFSERIYSEENIQKLELVSNGSIVFKLLEWKEFRGDRIV